MIPKYELVENPNCEFYCIKILSGDYTGVVYSYGVVSLDEKTAPPTLRFTFRVEDVTVNKRSVSELESDPLFKNMLGEILEDVMSTFNFNSPQ